MLTRLICAVALTAAVGAAVTPGALAGEIVGSPLDLAPDPGSVTRTGFLDVTAAQPPEVALPVAASAAGVITAIRLRHAGTGSDPGSLRFRIVSGAAGDLTARATARLPDLVLSVNASPSVLTVVPKDPGGLPHGVPIAAGERLGIGVVGATEGQEIRPFANAPGYSVRYRQNWKDGLAEPYLETPGLALLLQMTIEPDADHDGYGDDTEDRCVVDGSGPCIALPTCRVPRLAGLSLGAAQRVLLAAGCRLGTVQRRRGRGTLRVIRQSLAAGRLVKRATRVGVTLAPKR